MNVVIYARVSSEKQAEKDLSIKAQIKELRNYADKNKYTIVDQFVDEAISGRTDKRPAFQKMINLVKSKNPPFKAILVWKLNRFARDRKISILYKSMLRKNDIEVISINEPIDDSAAGKMLEGILESVDEFYSNNMAQDIKRGMKENASRGFYNGGIIPIGYKTKDIIVNGVKKKKLDIDTESSPIVKKIFELCLKGDGAKEIAKYLNENFPQNRPWNKNGILCILKNEAYIGTLVWNRNTKDKDQVVEVEKNHKSIISKPDFLRAQKILINRRFKVTHPRSVSSQNLLNGLMHCSSCNKNYTSYSAKSGKFHYYTCQSKFKSGNGICNQKSLPISKFDRFIVNVIKERILTPENIKKLTVMINKEIQSLRSEFQSSLSQIKSLIEDKMNRRDKLFDILEKSEDLNISDIAPRFKKLNGEISKLEAEKDNLEVTVSQNELPELTEDDLRPYIGDLHNILIMGSITEQKTFIKSFIKKIFIDYPTAIIEYTLPLSIFDNSKKEVLVFVHNGSA